MSNHELPGTGTAVLPVNAPPITLIITGNASLTEVSVARKTSLPISGVYDPVAKTANVKLLYADYDALKTAVAGGASVNIVYTYSDANYRVVSFTWYAVSAAIASEVPRSGLTSPMPSSTAVAETA